MTSAMKETTKEFLDLYRQGDCLVLAFSLLSGMNGPDFKECFDWLKVELVGEGMQATYYLSERLEAHDQLIGSLSARDWTNKRYGITNRIGEYREAHAGKLVEVLERHLDQFTDKRKTKLKAIFLKALMVAPRGHMSEEAKRKVEDCISIHQKNKTTCS